MATYEEIYGKRVIEFDSDPTLESSYEGQVWYDKSTGVLKSVVAFESWSSSSSVVKNSYRGGSAGIQTAALLFGGSTSYPFTFFASSGVTTSGTFVGRHGNVTNNAKSSAYVLVLSDAGKMINTDSNVTVPENLFSAGDVINVVNKSTSNISIVKGTGINLYIVGTSTNATVTLAQKGVAVITCFAGNDFIVGGGGVS